VRPVGRLDRYLAWTEGRLVFDDTPLTDVAEALERWYDLSIHFEDAALGKRRLTASFDSESAGEVLDAVALALGLSYRVDDRTVVLLRESSPG
jgi:transmembrane sensor